MALAVIVCPHNESAYHQMGWRQSMLQYFILYCFILLKVTCIPGVHTVWDTLASLDCNLQILNAVSIGTDKVKSHNLGSLELRIVTGGRVFLRLDQLKTSIL